MPISVARFLALLATIALGVGAWLSWIRGVSANHIPIQRLIGWHMRVETDTFYKSLAVVFVGCCVVAVIGILLPSRSAAFVAALTAVGVTALLLVQEWRFLPHHLNGGVVGAGVWCTGAGAIVLLLASFGLYIDVQRSVLNS